AEALGQRLQLGLQTLLRQHPCGSQVQLRCAGLLLGLEFADAGLAANMVMHLIDQRIVVNHSLNDHRVIRLTPPALYSDSDVEWLLGGFARAIARTFE
ncbi:aspartate aminotransferase family protein, partial [Pseudomonas sp. CM25]|nr:aspartate aminotransferase family protein [Pseudomonas sp. CM25]